jgi:hypothetical protein
MSTYKVSLRNDLRDEGMLVPGFDSITEAGEEIGLNWLSHEDLIGAQSIEDLADDKHPSYNYNRIELKDGKVFYMLGIDLDWIEE